MSLEKFTTSLFLALLGGLIALNAQARELSDMSLDIPVDKTGTEAKQDAFDQATETATRRLTEEIIGEEKTTRYWLGLKAKLLKNSTRYVLFIKGAPPQTVAGATHITVTLRLSPDSLESLLREAGMLTSGTTVHVLPLVQINDSHASRYLWWADTRPEDKLPLVADIFKKFHDQLAAKLKTKNLFLLDPTSPSFRLSTPAAYRTDNLRREDQALFAQYLKADVVVSGAVSVDRAGGSDGPLKLTYDLQIWQAKSGRGMGDIQRSEPLPGDAPKVVIGVLEQVDRKVLDEVARRIGEAVTGGNLNLNVVRVAVTGMMNYRQQAEFKRQLSQLREIRVLKERLFEPLRVTFEAETPLSGQELAKAVQKFKFSQYSVQVEAAQDDSLGLTVHALSSPSVQ